MDICVKSIEEVMKMCVNHAKKTVNDGIGGPFGAAIVKYRNDLDGYQIVCIGSNTVLGDKDPTAHAEMNVIRRACKMLNTFDLTGYILVTTGKSCPMCISSAIWSNLNVVYYGTTYEDATLSGFRDDHILQYLKGENTCINEVNICRDVALELHEVWKQKQDKIQY